MDKDIIIYCVLGLAAIAVLIAFIRILAKDVRKYQGGTDWHSLFQSEKERAVKRAGNAGEAFFTEDIVKPLLKSEDRLFTGLKLAYDGKKAELDDVIVNKYGVFIIEVKNFVGRLYGEEDDYNWKKEKVSYNDRFTKTTVNPISQMKRQVYILRKILDAFSVGTWIEGRVYFINDNLINGEEPWEFSDSIIREEKIGEFIHTKHGRGDYLSQSKINAICDILKNEKCLQGLEKLN